MKLLRGRDFTQAEAENRDTPRVGIIDEEMARKLFPNTEAVGQHIRYTQPPKDGSPNDLLVVGVVSSHRHDVQNDTLKRRLFVPLSQGYNGNVYLHVRLATKDRHAVAAFIPTMRQTLRSIDPDLPILSITPFVDLTGEKRRPVDRASRRVALRSLWRNRVGPCRGRCVWRK